MGLNINSIVTQHDRLHNVPERTPKVATPYETSYTER